VPGVADVGWSTALPLGESVFGEYPFHYEIVGDAPVDDARKPTTGFQIVSSTYFSALELPIVAGRGFDSRDTPNNPRVVIVNEAFARSLGGRNPIGLQISFKPVQAPPTDKPTIAEIVGVAKQVKLRPDEAAEYVQMYVPFTQDPVDDVMLLVRSKTGRADALTPSVRAAISRIDKEQLVSVASITTLEDVEWVATGRHRFRAVMVGAFAVLALVLAMVGVFGILAYSVQQRMRDFGVRRVLGASSRDVLSLVVQDAAKVLAIGAAVGLILAAMLGRLITSMLFGVQPLDAGTFAFVTVVLAATAAAAIAGPAWRATRIDPVVVLRSK
jgi:putative ABC transport system permease protein